MQQTRYDFQATLENPFTGISQVKSRWGINNYQHDVFVEGHGVETRLKNDEIEGRLEFLHNPIGNWNGVLGLQYMDRDFTAEGEEAFTPPSTQRSIAVFGLEKAEFSNFHVDVGFRYEHQSANTSEADKQTHDSFSLSAGTRWDYTDGYQLALSVTHSQRAPDIQELFTTEPAHPANGTFVIRDPNLGIEKSSNFDLSWHKVSGHFSFTANAFYQRIDNFIFLQENDLNNDGFADRVEDHFDGDIDEILDPDHEEGLFLVNQTQEDVDLKGIELETVFRLREDDNSNLDLRLWTDFVRGKRNDGVNLPRITPWRFGSSIDYGYDAWIASLAYHRVGSQNDIAPLETSTSSYDMLDFYAAYTFEYSGTNFNVFIKGSNLLDQDARRHTSFLKNSVPQPGRSFILGLRSSF